MRTAVKVLHKGEGSGDGERGEDDEEWREGGGRVAETFANLYTVHEKTEVAREDEEKDGERAKGKIKIKKVTGTMTEREPV